MGINIEFNPELCLRDYNSKGRLKEECIPKTLEIGKIYPFVKNHGINSMACLVLEHAPKWIYFLSIKIDRVR
jgi:hypothetical protein